MTLQWRPVAVSSGVAAAPNVRRCYCFFFIIFYPLTTFPFLFLCFRFLLLPPLFYLSLFFFLSYVFSLPSLSFVLSLPLSLLCFFFPLPPLSSPSLSSPLFLFFSPPLFSAFLGSIYRGQGRCFLQLSRGAAGWSAIGRGCRGSVGGARWVVSHCVRSVGSRRESGRQKFKLKLPFLLLPRCVIGGRR